MEGPVEKIHRSLTRLIGLYRQLLETVRAENQALVHADLKIIQETTLAKQALIETVKQAESERLSAQTALAKEWNRPIEELTLSAVIIGIQGVDPKGAEVLRSEFHALTLLVRRVAEQNQENSALVDRCLAHIGEMRRNVLGEATPGSAVYDQHGRQSNAAAGARLISREV